MKTIIKLLSVLILAAVSALAQVPTTPVLFQTWTVTGVASNATVQITPFQAASLNQGGVLLDGPIISVTASNGIAQTNLADGLYRVGWVGNVSTWPMSVIGSPNTNVINWTNFIAPGYLRYYTTSNLLTTNIWTTHIVSGTNIYAWLTNGIWYINMASNPTNHSGNAYLANYGDIGTNESLTGTTTITNDTVSLINSAFDLDYQSGIYFSGGNAITLFHGTGTNLQFQIGSPSHPALIGPTPWGTNGNGFTGDFQGDFYGQIIGSLFGTAITNTGIFTNATHIPAGFAGNLYVGSLTIGNGTTNVVDTNGNATLFNVTASGTVSGNGAGLNNLTGPTCLSWYNPYADGGIHNDDAAVNAMISYSISHSNSIMYWDTNRVAVWKSLHIWGTNNLHFIGGFSGNTTNEWQSSIVAYTNTDPPIVIGNDSGKLVENILFENVSISGKSTNSGHAPCAVQFMGGCQNDYFSGCRIIGGTNQVNFVGGVNAQVTISGLINHCYLVNWDKPAGTNSQCVWVGGTTQGAGGQYPGSVGTDMLYLTDCEVRGGFGCKTISVSNAWLNVAGSYIDGGESCFNSYAGGYLVVDQQTVLDTDGQGTAQIFVDNNTNQNVLKFVVNSEYSHNGNLRANAGPANVRANTPWKIVTNDGQTNLLDNYYRGSFAGFAITTGHRNFLDGDGVGNFQTTASDNFLVGDTLFSANVAGGTNIGMGYNSMGRDTNVQFSGIFGYSDGTTSTNAYGVYGLGGTNNWSGGITDAVFLGNGITLISNHTAYIAGPGEQTVIGGTNLTVPVLYSSGLIQGTSLQASNSATAWINASNGIITGANPSRGSKKIVFGFSPIQSNNVAIESIDASSVEVPLLIIDSAGNRTEHSSTNAGIWQDILDFPSGNFAWKIGSGAASVYTNVLVITANTFSVGPVVIATNGVTTGHMIGFGSSPTIAAGAGAGGSPTVSISGTDLGGTITITSGTLPSVSSVICTVTFAKSFLTTSYPVIWPSNSAAATLGFNPYVSGVAASFTINSGITGLGAATTYTYNYMVTGL